MIKLITGHALVSPLKNDALMCKAKETASLDKPVPFEANQANFTYCPVAVCFFYPSCERSSALSLIYLLCPFSSSARREGTSCFGAWESTSLNNKSF